MEDQENIEEDVKIIIPIKKIQKFKHFLDIKLNQDSKFLQLYEIKQNSKQKNALSCYSAESIIKLFKVVNQNSNYFLRMYALNTSLSKNNKKQFIVTRMLRQSGVISFYQICEQLKIIRKQIRDKTVFEEYIRFIKLFLQKCQYLLYKFGDSLILAVSDCVSFYLKKPDLKNVQAQNSKSQDQIYFEVVIGFNKLSISFYSTTDYVQNVINQHKLYLSQICSMCDYDWNNCSKEFNQLKTTFDNKILQKQIPSLLLKNLTYEKKTYEKQSLPESFYTSLIIEILVKYAEDIFFLIQASIVFLTNLVLEKKQLKNINYNQQFIVMEEFRQKKVKETYMNLYCQHFQGINIQFYKNDQHCPICGQKVLVDQLKSFQRNKNVFQQLLSYSYLNPSQNNVIYYFKNKIFCLATKDKFANYAHFCQFIKKENNIRDRPQITLLLEVQRISLYNKLWGKKKLFLKEEIISTPVRGKYCRHIEFFQLMRVYELYLNRQEDQTQFQCFLCMEPIEFADIMYLHQIKLLIDIVKLNFYNGINISLNSWIQLDHRSQQVTIGSELDKGYLRKTFSLNIYDTIIDPLTKSQKVIQKKQFEDKRQEQQQQTQCNFNDQFQRFYFGL